LRLLRSVLAGPPALVFPLRSSGNFPCCPTDDLFPFLAPRFDRLSRRVTLFQTGPLFLALAVFKPWRDAGSPGTLVQFSGRVPRCNRLFHQDPGKGLGSATGLFSATYSCRPPDFYDAFPGRFCVFGRRDPPVTYFQLLVGRTFGRPLYTTSVVDFVPVLRYPTYPLN